MSGNFDFIVTFQIYGRFEKIRSAAWSMILVQLIINDFHVWLTMFYLTKTENRTKKSLTQPSCYSFEKRYYFCLKILTFYKKIVKTEKFRSFLQYKVCFLKLPTYFYLRTKFQGSSITLTRSRQEVILPLNLYHQHNFKTNL